MSHEASHVTGEDQALDVRRTQAQCDAVRWPAARGEAGCGSTSSLPHSPDHAVACRTETRCGSRNRATEIERGSVLERDVDALRAMGHEISLIDFPSGLHGIVITPDGLMGGSDPRREGEAGGDGLNTPLGGQPADHGH